MESFIQKVYPDECNHDRIGHDLCMLGTNYINKGDYVSAVKLLKAGAILCNDGQCQNYLGVMYNAGAGVKKMIQYCYIGLIVRQKKE